ncbi:MAG: tRNA (N6-threonylcarbamoyladenosine(37)-N6)-methyltransferase TrmO [Anaerolineales bacterium]|nr:tRNA (N6-threonylcarbamoyladenosine(37)-N6)-methyltransferase TrmO [Anaerolineales bacterium]
MEPIFLRPLGAIHTPYREIAGMPIQSVGAVGVAGWIELAPEFQAGLQDVAGLEYLILIYHLHRQTSARLSVIPFLDNQPRGVFATRSPQRPNALGLSIVRLVAVDGLRLDVEDVDMLDGTPLLDIKPYVPAFDVRHTERVGWFAGNAHRAVQARADERFTPPAGEAA